MKFAVFAIGGILIVWGLTTAFVDGHTTGRLAISALLIIADGLMIRQVVE
jgi:hypothetical protein